MAWSNEFFVAHRKHPVYMFKTIEITKAEHLTLLRMDNCKIARQLGLVHVGNNLFRVPDVRDQETVMQDVERALGAYDAAVANE